MGFLKKILKKILNHQLFYNYMRGIITIVMLLEIILIFIISKFKFPEPIQTVLVVIAFGMLIFIVASALVYLILSLNKRGEITKRKIIIRKIKANILGIIIMIVFSLLFLNLYLYLKSMMGNDLLLSLNVDNENIYIQNGDKIDIGINARVISNLFCSADCSLKIEDLSSGEKVFYEEINIKTSSVFSKHYTINPNEEKYGQKLYKVSLECNNTDSNLCYYKSYTKYRTKIVSVDYYLNDVQTLIKDNLKNNTETLYREYYYLENELNSLNLKGYSLYLPELEKEYTEINNSMKDSYIKLEELKKLYYSQEYFKLGTEIYSVASEIVSLSNKINQFNSSFYTEMNTYNSLVDDAILIHREALLLKEYSFTSFSIRQGELFVNNFNRFILRMSDEDTLKNKLDEFREVEIEFINLMSLLESERESNFENLRLQTPVIQLNLEKILFSDGNYTSSFTLEEPSPVCCLYGECYDCIDDSGSNYPIIFVHGHSFNEGVSSELSMDSFSEMARELEKEGYIDAGYFYRRYYNEDSQKSLGKVNSTILVEATYYIDTLLGEETSFVVNSKWETISTYSSRLSEIILNVKHMTGKDKVIIVAHSMGGLVTREYIRNYGYESLDKIIFVGTPHHGVDGFILSYCPIFGAEIECSEMNKSSKFISDLNSAPLPDIPIYNIVGLGCYIEGSDGDGIVKNSSAYLEGTENIFINGECNGVDFFHVNMIKPEKHPDIYELIKTLINKKD